jgi:hypothetical protein
MMSCLSFESPPQDLAVSMTAPARIIESRRDGLLAVATEQTPVLLIRPGVDAAWSSTDDLVSVACDTAGRNLTKAELDLYLPGWEVAPICASETNGALTDGSPVVGAPTTAVGRDSAIVVPDWPPSEFDSALKTIGIDYAGPCDPADDTEVARSFHAKYESSTLVWCSEPVAGSTDEAVFRMRPSDDSSPVYVQISMDGFGYWVIANVHEPSSRAAPPPWLPDKEVD